MYRCEECNTLSKPSVPATIVVTQTRPRTYTDPFGEPIGFGKEIVKEKKLCTGCAEKYKAVEEPIAAPPKPVVVKRPSPTVRKLAPVDFGKELEEKAKPWHGRDDMKSERQRRNRRTRGDE